MISFRTRWKIYEQIRNSIWIVPAVFSTVAIIMGILIPNFDEQHVSSVGISYGPSAAQGILGALAGGMITFTGFVFSILLLAVQFGSSQFSPRMLRRFLRDPTTKVALGLFMATFLYALLVLRTLEPAHNEGFVPDYSVSISLLLLLLSMMMFLRLISRTTQGLRVASVLSDLGRDGARRLAQIYPDSETGPEEATTETSPGTGPANPDSRLVGFSDRPGILQSIDRPGLVALARQKDVMIELITPIGDQVYPGSPLFLIHGDGEQITDEHLMESIAVGDERNMGQDPAFLFRLLADISSKALSPGVNDPTTSIQALDQIELLLRQLSSRRLTPGTMEDETGTVRLTYPTPSWSNFLSIALDETRYFGSGSIQVVRRLRALLENLRDTVPDHRQAAVNEQMVNLEESVKRSFPLAAELKLAATGDRQGIGSRH